MATRPGYQGSHLWWKLAQHLDETFLASINVMAIDLDGQEDMIAFQGKLREAQALLLGIFRGKNLLPAAAPSKVVAPPAAPQAEVTTPLAGGQVPRVAGGEGAGESAGEGVGDGEEAGEAGEGAGGGEGADEEGAGGGEEAGTEDTSAVKP
jgi:hypothetical protein